MGRKLASEFRQLRLHVQLLWGLAAFQAVSVIAEGVQQIAR
jgi:hypothetical protein